MKRSFIFGIVALMIMACSTSKEVRKTSASLVPGTSDSLGYEIRVLDPQFDHWYLTNYSAAKDRTNDFYRENNLRAVGTWNDYFRTGRYMRFIDTSIDYHPDVDYGIEVNRILYWYFVYVQEQYKIPLVR